jgi:hypothetical protein
VWRVKPRFFYVYHISHFCVHNLAKLHRIRCKIWTSLSYLRSLLQTFIFYQLSVQSKRSGLSLQAKRFFVFFVNRSAEEWVNCYKQNKQNFLLYKQNVFVEPVRGRMGELLQAKGFTSITFFCWTDPRKNGWTELLFFAWTGQTEDTMLDTMAHSNFFSIEFQFESFFNPIQYQTFVELCSTGSKPMLLYFGKPPGFWEAELLCPFFTIVDFLLNGWQPICERNWPKLKGVIYLFQSNPRSSVRLPR